MFERTKLIMRLYRQAIPKEPLRKKVFLGSQLILLTGVPAFTICQIIGGIWIYPSLAYLMILCLLTTHWSGKMARELLRQEHALQVAERLRGDMDA